MFGVQAHSTNQLSTPPPFARLPLIALFPFFPCLGYSGTPQRKGLWTLFWEAQSFIFTHLELKDSDDHPLSFSSTLPSVLPSSPPFLLFPHSSANHHTTRGSAQSPSFPFASHTPCRFQHVPAATSSPFKPHEQHRGRADVARIYPYQGHSLDPRGSNISDCK